jgi:hypothetical protein
VSINGQVKTVVGRVREPYKPRLLAKVEDQIADKQVTPEMMAGYYAEAAREVINRPSVKENVRASIESFISPETAKGLRAAPERVLKSAEVVVNEHQVKEASYRSYDAGNGKKFSDMTVELTDEGQKRLWKYSVNRVGSQLLLIVDGVAIAAPRIERALTESELTIKRMGDEVLARDAVERLNKATKGANGK